MNYYLDQEFHEYFRKPIKWLPTIGNFNKKYHTIELISIGIVAEDGREYYAVCNEFDVSRAYKKYDKKQCCHIPEFCTAIMQGACKGYKKEYWLRDNVLKPIFFSFYKQNLINLHYTDSMSLHKMKDVIKSVGKSKKQIKYEINHFICSYENASEYAGIGSLDSGFSSYLEDNPPVFYGYYSDYDWVLFCSLYGTMMDLPKGFPMYCRDLQQMKDDYKYLKSGTDNPDGIRKRVSISEHPDYPKQSNEHHALADAKWSKQLHDFLKKLNN